MTRAIRALLPLLVWCCIEGAIEYIPRAAGTSLTGERVELPRDLEGPVSFLIVGFSQKSAAQAEEWGKAIDGLGLCHGRRLTWFQLPVIASAPGFVRPLIMRSMRSGLTRNVQKRFVPITEHEGDWKLAAGFQATDPGRDDAYVLAVDEQGRIAAKWRGPRTGSDEDLRAVFRQFCGAPEGP